MSCGEKNDPPAAISALRALPRAMTLSRFREGIITSSGRASR